VGTRGRTPLAREGGVIAPGPVKKARKKLSTKARKAIGTVTKKRWAEGKMKRGRRSQMTIDVPDEYLPLIIKALERSTRRQSGSQPAG